MSIVVHRRAIILLAAVTSAATIATAAIGYATALSLSTSASDVGTAKLLAERVFFVGLVGSLVVIITSTAVVLRSMWISARLQKLVEMSRMSGFSTTSGLNQLGEIGRQIAELYAPMADVSNKKSRKISALTALTQSVMEMTSQPVLVVDATGVVTHVSGAALERAERNRAQIVGQHLDTVLPQVDVSAALRELQRTRAPVRQEREDHKPLEVRPILNSAGELAYAVVLLSPVDAKEIKGAAASELAERRTPIAGPRARTGLLARLFGQSARRLTDSSRTPPGAS